MKTEIIYFNHYFSILSNPHDDAFSDEANQTQELQSEENFGVRKVNRLFFVSLYLSTIFILRPFSPRVAPSLNVDTWMEASQPSVILNESAAREVMAIFEETQNVSIQIKNTRKGR